MVGIDYLNYQQMGAAGASSSGITSQNPQQFTFNPEMGNDNIFNTGSNISGISGISSSQSGKVNGASNPIENTALVGRLDRMDEKTLTPKYEANEHLIDLYA